jgi:hypothetical protein
MQRKALTLTRSELDVGLASCAGRCATLRASLGEARNSARLLFDLLLLLNSSSTKSVEDFVSLSPAIAADQGLFFARRTSSLLTVVGYHCLP